MSKSLGSIPNSLSIRSLNKRTENSLNSKPCGYTTNNVKNIHEKLFRNRKKTAIVMIGGPGSGKSVIKYNYINTLNRDQREFVNLDPDFVLENMRSYKEKIARSNSNAASKCKTSADMLRDKLHDYAISEQFNLILDGTGKDFEYTKSVIEDLNNNDYLVHLVIVNVDQDIGLQRVKDRAMLTKRNIPTNVVKNIYSKLEINVKKYFELENTSLYKLVVYDNNEYPKIVYESK